MKWPVANLANILLDARSGTWGEPAVGNGSDYPVLRSTNIHDGQLVLEDVALRSLPERIARKYELQTGDILVTTSSGSLDLIGKNALFDDPRDGQTYLFSNFTQRLRPNSDLIIPRFLHLYLNSSQAKVALLRIQSTTSGLRNLNVKLYLAQTVPLPCMSEQRRIVEILDQADALRKKRAEADAKADHILPALFIKMFGDPVNWASMPRTESLGDIVELQSGGTPSKQNPDYWIGEIPWVSPKDMKQDILFDATDHISREAVEETNLKYVEPGTILIVVRGMILAHTVPIALAGCRLTINQDMKALSLKCNNVDSNYLYAAMKASSRVLLSQVRTAAHGTRKLDTDELLEIPILVPPSQDQEKFRREMTASTQIVSAIRKTGEKLTRLFETLLHRAFSGDLTAKWRETHMKELLVEMEEQARTLNGERPDTQTQRLLFSN